MRKLVPAILAAVSLVSPSLRANPEVGREVGVVLGWRLGPAAVEEHCRGIDPGGNEIRAQALKSWIEKNDKLIHDVDARVAEVLPLIQPKPPVDKVVQATHAAVRDLILEEIFAGKSAEESRAICRNEADPAGKRWNNPGMPNVPLSLAALYDWKMQHAGK